MLFGKRMTPIIRASVDGLFGSDGDGVEVDRVFKDAESIEVDGMDEGGVILPIFN